jgi:hypothetical protein
MTSAAQLLIAAVLVQGALALLLLWRLGAIRVPLVYAGKIRMDQVALSRDPWPDREKRVANAFDNQFQLPTLFYVAAGLSLYFPPSLLEVVLAWLFVLSRIAHAAIFVTDNHVVRRFSAYTFGYAVLAVFWIDLIVRLLISHPAGS